MKVSQDAYTTSVTKTQEKLLQSNATYEQIAASLGTVAAEQERWQHSAATMQFQISTGQASAGSSLGFGLQNAAHQQGNTDQQYMKLGGDLYNQLGQTGTTVFDQLINNNGRLSESWSQMGASILRQIAIIIEHMLVMQAVQAAVSGIGSLFGPSVTTYSLGTTDSGAAITGGGFVGGSYFHSGGMVGYSPSFTQSLPMAAFLGAERFHSGGGYGLAPDERPAVLQVGERVLNRQETNVYHRYYGLGGILGMGASAHPDISASGVRRFHDGGMVDDLTPISGLSSRAGATAGGQGGGVNISVPVTIQPSGGNNSGNSSGGGASSAQMQRQAQDLSKQITGLVRQELQNQKRYAGILNPR